MIHVIQMLGDLPRDGEPSFTAFNSLAEALDWLGKKYGREFVGGWSGDEIMYETPDPEDDRILIWEVAPPYMRVVWHFSGWHWDGEASDCVGGPLPQGVLPGHDRSLYELAMVGY